RERGVLARDEYAHPLGGLGTPADLFQGFRAAGRERRDAPRRVARASECPALAGGRERRVPRSEGALRAARRDRPRRLLLRPPAERDDVETLRPPQWKDRLGERRLVRRSRGPEPPRQALPGARLLLRRRPPQLPQRGVRAARGAAHVADLRDRTLRQ